MSWHLGMLGAFDLESTGVDTRQARIVTGYVATVLSQKDRRRIRVETQVLIRPGDWFEWVDGKDVDRVFQPVSIPEEASRVHGITNEIAQAKGCDPIDGINSIAEALAQLLKAGIPVVTFNGSYDFSLLYRECLRHKLPTVAERLGRPPASMVGPIIDASVLDKHFDQYRKGSRKLTDVTAHYGITLDNAHTADADAIAALRVAVAVATKFAGVDMPTDVVALHHMQKAWRADQAAGLQRHFRTKGGRPDAYVDPCWPLCTDDTHPSG